MAADKTESAAAQLSDAAIDALILGALDGEWRHVAIVIARVVDAAKAEGDTVTGQQIAARIYLIAEARQLDVQGNIRRWRAGKVRAAGSPDAPAVPVAGDEAADKT